MSKSVKNKKNVSILIFTISLFCAVFVGYSLITYKTQAATKNNHSLKSFIAPHDSAPVANIGERTSVWLKMQEGKPLDTTFHGNDSAISALRSNLAEPLSQVSADFNADGYNDLISGFRNGAGGGLIALHRASRQAFEPTDEQVLTDLKRGIFPATFEKDALILDVPTAPDFIFAGRFSQDSDVDLVFASRGGGSIYIMSSDGRGGFNPAREIALDGEISAMASDSFDASKIYAGLVVASRNGKSSTISIFDGSDELTKTTPRGFEVKGEINSLILANPGGIAQGKDVFGIADGEIFTMRRAGNPNTSIDKIELPFRAAGIAVGEFIRDREARAEIAVLGEDGNVSYLTRGTLDTRPFMTEEVLEIWRENGGRGRGSLTTKTTTNDLSDDWSVAESHQLGVYSLSGNSSARTLQKAYITGNETDDLLVMDATNNRVQILFKEPNYDADRTSFTGNTKFQNVDFAASPASVLPMRLNVMGQQGFVFFSKGSLEPTAVIAAPNATFNVTTLNDENNGACSAAGTGCSPREAINAANAAAGADMITFTPNGTHTLTINVAGTENAGTEGDLDVTQALTIVGNGTGNTILQGGASVGTGIDKIISFNANFTSAFASSMTGVTVRFGNNPSTFASFEAGGGFDWEGSGTGTLNVSGSIVTDNRTLDNDGGGVVVTNSVAGAGSFTGSNLTISNNMPARIGAPSPLGGGLYVGLTTPFFLTNVVINNNNVNGSGGQGQGGGIYAFGPSGAGGFSSLTGSSVTNNTAPNDGGGILTTQRLDINPTSIISNNSSGRFGGGIWINHSNATSTFSKLTMVGNSATTNGGAIYLASSTTANVLNVSFSRIVGNTGGGFRGLAVDAGTANVENNWWGCNTGPSAAPCDTAGVIGTGTVDFNPWLQLRLTASPNTTPVVGESRSLTASFLLNSANQVIAASNLDVLIGLPITWSASGGTISGQQTTIQASGTATANFSSSTAGGGKSATAQVDNGPATVNFTVGQAATTTTITSDNPDPSVVGQTITVTYTVTVNPPGGGTPTGTVTVSDGVNSCMGTVAAGSCNVALTTLGARTLTATYSDPSMNFLGSSDTEPHQVNMANTTTTITAESADPTAQGEVFTVFYSVAVTAPGAGTSSGTVTVTDGINSCMGTVMAGQCSLFLNTAGMRTLTATYAGNLNYNGSVSPGEPHTVLPIVAASVSISGRVQTQSGSGIANARVILTDQNGEVVTAVSNSFGYYHFEGIQAGETYFFTVRHKEYQFTPQAVTINEDVQGLDFTALE